MDIKNLGVKGKGYTSRGCNSFKVVLYPWEKIFPVNINPFSEGARCK